MTNRSSNAPESLRLEGLNSVVAFDAETQSWGLTRTERNQATVQIAVFTLKAKVFETGCSAISQD